MNNPRMTAKERGLVKGAIRRVFSRSDLRRAVLAAAKVEHADASRPRVKTWYQCRICSAHCAGYEMQVDHISPIVPTDSSLEQMSWDTVIDRMWCDKNNLKAICISCHKAKSKVESQERRKNKKEKTNG